MDKRFTGIGLGLLLAVLSAVTMAAITHPSQATLVAEYPLYSTPDTDVESVGGTITQAIADCTNTGEDHTQKLIITNTHASNKLCVCWVAAGAACAGCDCDQSGTDDGALVMPSSAWAVSAACDLRTCIVASATSTVVHTSRQEI